MRRILLLNPNTTASITASLERFAALHLGTRARITAVTAPFGAPALETEADLALAAQAVAEMIASHPDHDVAIIAAFGDPGLASARRQAPMPVLGIGEEGFLAAGAGGRRFAVVTLGAAMRGSIERKASDLGLAPRLTGITIIGGAVLAVAAEPGAFHDRLVAAARAAVEHEGAEAVLFGGAPFAGIGAAIADRVPVPVIDGVSAALDRALVILG